MDTTELSPIPIWERYGGHSFHYESRGMRRARAPSRHLPSISSRSRGVNSSQRPWGSLRRAATSVYHAWWRPEVRVSVHARRSHVAS